MIKVVTNSLGSGDWITVLKDDEEIWCGHRVGVYDLVSILGRLQPETLVRVVEITDEDLQEGDY